MLTEDLMIRPLGPDDQAWVQAWMIDQWGAASVVAHGQVFYPAQLPGFVVFHGGERTGLLTYSIAGGECEVVTINSLREKRGAGTALILAVENAAREAGCRRVWLITTNDNLNALRFYQKRGYRLVKVDPGAVDRSRLIKPEIPATGYFGIPIRDEIELEKGLQE